MSLDAPRTAAALAFCRRVQAVTRPGFAGGLPLTLGRARLLAELRADAFAVSAKADGQRALLGFARLPPGPAGRPTAFLVDRRQCVTLWADAPPAYAAAYAGTLLDVERVGAVLYVFDALALEGVTVTEQAYHTRLDVGRHWVHRLATLAPGWAPARSPQPLGPPAALLPGSYPPAAAARGGPWCVAVKAAYYAHRLGALPSVAARRAGAAGPLATDGLVWTRVHHPYPTFTQPQSVPLLKWKFPELRTVDFEVGPAAGRAPPWTDGSPFTTKPAGGVALGVRDGPALLWFASLPPGAPGLGALGPAGGVVECAWSASAGSWYVYGTRPDKARANQLRTASATLESVADGASLEDLLALYAAPAPVAWAEPQGPVMKNNHQ